MLIYKSLNRILQEVKPIFSIDKHINTWNTIFNMGLFDEQPTVPQATAETPITQPAVEQTAVGVITKDQAVAKIEEAKSAMSSFMDRMEASTTDQGDYFLKVGEKGPSGDDRVLALRSPGEAEDQPGRVQKFHIAVTQDGFKRILDSTGSHSVGVDEKIASVAHGQAEFTTNPIGDRLGYKKGDDKEALRLDKIYGDSKFIENLTSSAIENSIKSAESPHKARFDDANSRIDVASALSAKLGVLPPRE